MALQEELEKEGLWLFKLRSYLPIIILLLAIVVHYFRDKETLAELSPYTFYYEIICLMVSFFGLAIRIYTVGHTPKDTSGRNTVQGQVAETLNTTGIYSVVRHPLYLGNFFMWLGPALLVRDVWFIVAFVLFYWVYYERIMYAEEQFLRRKFGHVYTEWASKTPAFIPKIKGFNSSNLCFSWKKVAKKEKNGILAIFIIFLLFNVVGELDEKRAEYNLFFIYGTAVSAIIYVVLKCLKSYTRYLDEKGR